jgi:ADP-ribose pyrophosphatase
MMDVTEKTVSPEQIYDGKVVHLYKDTVLLPDGAKSIREYVRHVGAVCVLPLTDQNEVILERQYRYAVGQVLVEIPAGKRDREDEDWAQAALRELREETGAIPDELIDFGDYYGSPAIMGERIRMFLARGLHFTESKLDEGEFLEVFRMPLETAVEAVLRGEIPDGKTQAANLRTALYLKEEEKN